MSEARRMCGAVALVVVLILVPLLSGGASGHAPRSASTTVTAILQSPGRITEQDNFTISMQVASPANIVQVFFTFCQLTNGLCYLPIVMNPQPNNWFNGTTNRMAAYHGMLDGIRAGYNITINYQDGSNATYPSIPNQFGGLAVSEILATREWVYEMVVSPQVYGLSGSVHDQSTGAAVVGADVTLSPGNGTTTVSGTGGAYSFVGLPNGTYTLSVTKAGYQFNSLTVAIAGKTAVQNVAITNVSTPAHAAHGAWWGFFTTPLGVAVLVGVLVAVVLAAVGATSMSRKKKREERGSAAESESASPPNAP